MMGQGCKPPFPHLYVLAFASLIDHSTIALIVSSYAKSIGASSEMAGLIAGSYSMAALLSYPVVGLLLDKFTRTRVILAFYSLDLIVVSMYLFSRDPMQLLIVRFLHGFLDAAIFPSSLALFRDFIWERFGPRLTIYWAVAATPILIGNVATRILATLLGFHSVIMLALFTMALGLYSSYSLNALQMTRILAGAPASRECSSSAVSISIIMLSCSSAFTLYMLIGSVIGSMPLSIASAYGLSREAAASEVATWSAIATAISIPLMLGVARYFVENFERALKGLMLGLLSTAASSLLLVLSLESSFRYLSSLIFGLSLALILTTTSRIALDVPYGLRGRSSAALGASYLLGVAVGAPLSSSLLLKAHTYNVGFLPPLVVSLIVLMVFAARMRLGERVGKL